MQKNGNQIVTIDAKENDVNVGEDVPNNIIIPLKKDLFSEH